MDQSQPEIATEEDEAAKKKRSVCETCDKPVVHGASGTISMWIFDGIYCSCEPEKRTGQILYFGTNSESGGEQEAAALANLLASTGSSANPSDTATRLKLVTADFSPETFETKSPVQVPVTDETVYREPPKLRLVPNLPPDGAFVSIAADGVPPDALPNITVDSTELYINFDFRPSAIRAQFSTETQTETLTREIVASGKISVLQPESLVGKIIGENYLVIEFIGKGQSGSVYKVNRDGIPGVFALKILHPARFSTRQNTRFLAQAKAVKELDHHSLLTLYDAGVTDDLCPFIVTDFFGSERLSDTLKLDGPFNETEAIELFLEVAEALAQAHYMGITHRDVKPSNVRVKENDDGSRVIKLADCGVGKMYPDPSRETRYFTESGMEYGDPRYMSPEQYSGVKADHRADIYSFGCLMYEVLTGRPPFVADRASMLIYKHIKKWPKAISERVPDSEISPALENLIMRCLQKHPDNRYQTVTDIREDLETIRAGKPVRRVFRTPLSKSPAHAIPQNVTELVIPDPVLSQTESFMAGISAAWFAFWIGYSASARLSIKIVAFSACVAFLIFTWFKQHQTEHQKIQYLRDWNHQAQLEDQSRRERFQYPNDVELQTTGEHVRSEYAGANPVPVNDSVSLDKYSTLWTRKRKDIPSATQQRWADLASQGQWSELAREQRLEFDKQ